MFYGGKNKSLFGDNNLHAHKTFKMELCQKLASWVKIQNMNHIDQNSRCRKCSHAPVKICLTICQTKWSKIRKHLCQQPNNKYGVFYHHGCCLPIPSAKFKSEPPSKRNNHGCQHQPRRLMEFPVRSSASTVSNPGT